VKLAAVTLSLLVGCASVETGRTTTTAAEVGAVDTLAAATQIIHAHCARAQACGAYPSRGIYRDADYCETDLRRSTLDALDVDRCKSVDARRLDACIQALDRESCADMNYTELTPSACAREKLCR
jgi:hypothetical protein